MAHFAKLDRSNKVIKVHVVDNSVITDENGDEQEQLGIDYLTKLHSHSWWKQTSYNRNFRKNYANRGYQYDGSKDAFIPPKPFPSFVLNETTMRYEPPVEYPGDENTRYVWDEDTISWKEK